MVELLNRSSREVVRLGGSADFDEQVGGGAVVGMVAAAALYGREKDMGAVFPFAGCFGWASSFCSASYVSAARLLVNDFLTLLPLASRQSA